MTQTLFAVQSDADEQQSELKELPQTAISGTVSWHITSDPIWAGTAVSRADALQQIADGIAERHGNTFKRLAEE